MTLPYNNVEERSAQVWNADGRLFDKENSISLAPYLATDFTSDDSDPLSAIQLINHLDGSATVCGHVQYIGAPIVTTSPIIVLTPPPALFTTLSNRSGPTAVVLLEATLGAKIWAQGITPSNFNISVQPPINSGENLETDDLIFFSFPLLHRNLLGD